MCYDGYNETDGTAENLHGINPENLGLPLPTLDFLIKAEVLLKLAKHIRYQKTSALVVLLLGKVCKVKHNPAHC